MPKKAKHVSCKDLSIVYWHAKENGFPGTSIGLNALAQYSASVFGEDVPIKKTDKWKMIRRMAAFIEVSGFVVQDQNNVRAAPAQTESFYDSRAWIDMRYQVLVLYGAKCQCCGATRKDGVRMHVDHIKPRSKFPELELEISNLQILYESCNVGKSNKDATDWR